MKQKEQLKPLNITPSQFQGNDPTYLPCVKLPGYRNPTSLEQLSGLFESYPQILK